ncbi:lung seven transmembrane receptor-domain-containing protein [Tribonema minus]|uniref:Lung seven transmembrane receptor-domain-containing protein n=1 Tax=Tribonema minus TaxID=303371 RepID=A0A836CN10_9STRA|nr:lung seven transmembrane receptor-domain-containing protein [Tribonema minus]
MLLRKTLQALWAAAVCRWCSGLILQTSISQAGPSSVQLFSDFGLAGGGSAAFDVIMDMSVSSQRARGYIILAGRSAAASFFHPNLKGSPDWAAVCSAPSAARFEIVSTTSVNVTVPTADQYTAYLLLCQDLLFAGTVTTTLLNLTPDGELSQQLPIEDSPLPRLYTVVLVVWALVAALWLAQLWRCRAFVIKVHHMFTAVVGLRVVMEAVMAAYWYRLQQPPGSSPSLQRLASLLSNADQVLFIFTATLIGLGWGYMRQRLSTQEVRLLAVVFTAQSALSAAEALCVGGGPLCGIVVMLDYILRSLIMLTMVVAINFNIAHMRAALHVPWTSSMALEYLKLKQYLTFRWTFLAYLLLPIATLAVQYAVLRWEYLWVGALLEEFLMVVITVHIGVTFAPFNTWFITRAYDQSLE